VRAAPNCGPSRRVVALLAAPLAAAAVTLYPNASHADEDDDFGTPHITNVRLDGGTAYVTFVDNAVGEAGFSATVAERDHPDRTGLFDPHSDGERRERRERRERKDKPRARSRLWPPGLRRASR
jgi:hypothetical protein